MNKPDYAVAVDTHRFTTAARSALTLIILCGGIYPLVTTLLGGWLFPDQAGGSLVYLNNKAVGSELVGQAFSGNQYFYGRPSAIGYNPVSVSGSNLSPGNPALTERAAAESLRIQQMENVTAAQIPADMLAASGSGIDPHITPEAAILQAGRVAITRGMSVDSVRQLIMTLTEPRQLGVFGQPRVNVLKLNLALDKLQPSF